MNRAALSEAVKNRLRDDLLNGRADDAMCEYYASRLLRCEEVLLPNLLEWLNGKPLTEIWVHDKYCIGAVMKIRKSDDFIHCFLALDDYAKDSGSESAIWTRWA